MEESKYVFSDRGTILIMSKIIYVKNKFSE